MDAHTERRASTDRRTSLRGVQFPIITRGGVCIRRDRRHQADRRIAKIKVQEQVIHEEVFQHLFERFHGSESS